MKEYRVKVTVRNNLLLSAIENAGYKTQAEFARDAGLTPTHVTALVGLRSPPIGNNGEFTEVAKTVMEVLGASPSDLWTNEQLSMRLAKNSSEASMGKIEMLSALGENPVEMIDIKSPYQEFYEKERSNVVTDVLKTLTRREHHVICLRYGLENQKEHSLEEVAKIIDKTRERVRQIEMKAIRKLKHPTRSEILDKL